MESKSIGARHSPHQFNVLNAAKVALSRKHRLSPKNERGNFIFPFYILHCCFLLDIYDVIAMVDINYQADYFFHDLQRFSGYIIVFIKYDYYSFIVVAYSIVINLP